MVSEQTALGREILAFEAERVRALTENDQAALQLMLHADLTHIHSTGMVQGKAEFMAHIAKMGGFLAITREDLTLTDLGDGTDLGEGKSVLITGKVTNRVKRLDTGAIVDLNGISSLVLVRQAGRFQLILSQMTLVGRG